MPAEHPETQRRSSEPNHVLVRLSLGVEPGRDTRAVTGSLHFGARGHRRFHGWLGLLSELERIIDEADAAK